LTNEHEISEIRREITHIQLSLEVLLIRAEVEAIRVDAQSLHQAQHSHSNTLPAPVATSAAASTVPTLPTPLTFGVGSIQGYRDEMEDAHVAVIPFPQNGPENSALAAVFDGHGGDEASEYCSKKLEKFLLRQPMWPSEPTEAMRQTFLDLDKKFLAKAALNMYDSGTTAIVALVRNGYVHVAYAGDCRAVLSRRDSNAHIQLSDEHKPDSPPERARIEAVGYIVRQKRVDGQLAVSRAIGDADFKQSIGVPPEKLAVTPCPDFRSEKLNGQEEFLLLACDGLSDVMSNNDAIQFIRTALATYKRPYTAELLHTTAQSLAEHAVKIGSTDNVTCVLLAF